MPDYQKSKIYKLTCDDPELFYYGSTCEDYLSRRLARHKKDYRNEKYIRSKLLFDAGNVKIELVENFPCNNINELNVRERYYIKNNPCVNKIHPGRTKKEHYEENKEAILEKMKEYREDNVEIIKERKKKYYQKNKDKINEKITCPHCEMEMNRSSLKRHIKKQH